MNKKLISLLVLSILFLAGCGNSQVTSGTAEASGTEEEKTTIRLAYNLPPAHHVSQGVEEFAKNVTERSNGKIEMIVHPNGQLLSDKNMNQSVLTGGVEIGVNSASMWATSVPAMGVFDVPYIFNTYEEAGQALQGEFGDILRSEMEERGAKVLMFADYGYMQFANNQKPIEAPEDFEGMQFRSIGNLPSELIKAYGASPVFLGGGEVYMALQRGTVDGATSGTTAMVQRSYDEVADYLLVNNYAYLEFIVAINQEFWDGLDEETQSLIEEEALKTEEWIRETAEAEDERTKNELVERGMELYEITEEEIPAWREAALPVWDVFVEQTGEVGQELLDLVADK